VGGLRNVCDTLRLVGAGGRGVYPGTTVAQVSFCNAPQHQKQVNSGTTSAVLSGVLTVLTRHAARQEVDAGDGSRDTAGGGEGAHMARIRTRSCSQANILQTQYCPLICTCSCWSPSPGHVEVQVVANSSCMYISMYSTVQYRYGGQVPASALSQRARGSYTYTCPLCAV